MRNPPKVVLGQHPEDCCIPKFVRQGQMTVGQPVGMTEVWGHRMCVRQIKIKKESTATKSHPVVVHGQQPEDCCMDWFAPVEQRTLALPAHMIGV